MTDWKIRRDEILKITDNPDATRDELNEANNLLKAFLKDLEDNKFKDITKEDKVFLKNWCITAQKWGSWYLKNKNSLS